LDAGKTGLLSADVLVEPQFATGTQDPPDLGECARLVRHRAQHERRHGNIEAFVLRWQRVGGASDHEYGHCRPSGCLLGAGAQVSLGFHGENFGDGARVDRS